MLVHVSTFYCRDFNEYCVHVGLWNTALSHLPMWPEISTNIMFVPWNFCSKLSSMNVVVDSSSSFDVLCWAAKKFVEGDFALLCSDWKAKLVLSKCWIQMSRSFRGEVRNWGEEDSFKKRNTTEIPNKQKACCGHHCEYSGRRFWRLENLSRGMEINVQKH